MEELDVSISVPELILSGHCQSEFTMDIIEDTSYIPYLPFNATLASPVIHAGPHGAKFYSTVPATLKLPLGVVLEKEDELKCFVSDTDIDELPVWEEIEQEMVSIQGDYVVIKSTHFSLFCATAIKPYPKTERIISPEGGELLLEEIPELKVKFPNSAVDADIKASVTSLYYDPMYVLDTSDSDAKAIAAPVVSLGPSGTAFLDNVQITLPLPNAREVFQQFGNPGLTILCSHTDEGQRPNWEQLETTYTINEAQHVYTVTFNVHHFTMFQILWNILDAALPESIKLHASSHVPHFSFWVYFQTLMTECHHNRQFGLCVICYRFGNPVQGLAQYPIEVGTCKPKKVKTGEIIIQ